MADDKRNLLHSLAIDRAAPAPAQRRIWPWAAAVAVVLAVVAGFAASQMLGKDKAVPPPAVTPVAEPAPAAATPPRRAGALVASGYIVARRKATVAAEITGKVVEFNVEEGKVVTAGQVVAQLDSVLAETDLNLGQSGRAAPRRRSTASRPTCGTRSCIWTGPKPVAGATSPAGRADQGRGARRRASCAGAQSEGGCRNSAARRPAQCDAARQAQHPRAVQRRRHRQAAPSPAR